MSSVVNFEAAKRKLASRKAPGAAASRLSRTDELALLRMRLRVLHPNTPPLDPTLLGFLRW